MNHHDPEWLRLTAPQVLGYDLGVSAKKAEVGFDSLSQPCSESRRTPAVSAVFSFAPPVYGGSNGEPKGSPVPAGAARSVNPFELPPLIDSHGGGCSKPQSLEANMATHPESTGTTAVIPFNFNDNAVRAIDRDGAPWFSAADVCAALGVKNYRDSVAHLDDDERGVVSTDTPASNQHGPIAGQFEKMLVVNESGLYALVLRSRKPEARKFIKWVTSEVLPAIRKTGKYERPHNPAIDYDRISPAQAQDLKELVHSIAESKVQGFGETWARLHRKFRVNSYLELPATRFAEARDYLLGKLPAEPLALPAPADRLELAFSLAAQASAQVQRTVFNAVLAGGDEWQHSRYLLALTHDRRTNTATEPWAKALAHDAMVVSMDDLPTRLTAADPLPASDLQLARLSAACAQRMERRAQQRATHSTPQLRA